MQKILPMARRRICFPKLWIFSLKFTNKIALITGATRGIGYAVAKRFAAEGAHVIAVGRSKSSLEKLDNEIQVNSSKNGGSSATLVQLDLTEFDKIETLAQNIAQRFGKLDILVGNAGILGEITPMSHTTPAEWDKVIATNLTANFHLINHFDALLKQAENPRAMFVTSGVTSGTHAYWGAYAVSKAALEKMVETYAAENIKTALRVNLIDPKAVQTRMRAQAFPGEAPETLVLPENITDIFMQLASSDCTETGKKFFAQ
jgi:NAD(P)-dependent dehydrogenase (short-subunit alcohol dehydrogenase family)